MEQLMTFNMKRATAAASTTATALCIDRGLLHQCHNHARSHESPRIAGSLRKKQIQILDI
jgi:hypothetical protein